MLEGKSLRNQVAHVAQSVEHFLGKEEVTGSIPVVGSINISLPGHEYDCQGSLYVIACYKMIEYLQKFAGFEY